MNNFKSKLNVLKIFFLFFVLVLLCGCFANKKENINNFLVGKWMCFDDEAVVYLTFNEYGRFDAEYYSFMISGEFSGIYNINENKITLEYDNGNVRTEFIVIGKDSVGDYFFTHIDDYTYQDAISNGIKYRRIE